MRERKQNPRSNRRWIVIDKLDEDHGARDARAFVEVVESRHRLCFLGGRQFETETKTIRRSKGRTEETHKVSGIEDAFHDPCHKSGTVEMGTIVGHTDELVGDRSVFNDHVCRGKAPNVSGRIPEQAKEERRKGLALVFALDAPLKRVGRFAKQGLPDRRLPDVAASVQGQKVRLMRRDEMRCDRTWIMVRMGTTLVSRFPGFSLYTMRSRARYPTDQPISESLRGGKDSSGCSARQSRGETESQGGEGREDEPIFEGVEGGSAGLRVAHDL